MATVTLSAETMNGLRDFAKARDLKIDEAAEKVLASGLARLAAIAKHSKVLKKRAKEEAGKKPKKAAKKPAAAK